MKSSESQVRQAIAEAERAWSGVTLAPERFARHLAAHAAAAPGNINHLYLACACGEGDENAIFHVDRMLCQAVDRALSGRGFSPSEREEVVQRMRVRLLAAEGDKPPRILEYSGRGDLSAWLRVASLRQALNSRRQIRREEPLVEACACTGQTPESICAAAESREVFVSAFREGFAALSARERNLLRLHYVDGIELQNLASAYAVHRVTVGRWIEVARDRLRQEVEACLVTRMHLRTSEAARLVWSVRALGDLSLRQLLPRTIPSV